MYLNHERTIEFENWYLNYYRPGAGCYSSFFATTLWSTSRGQGSQVTRATPGGIQLGNNALGFEQGRVPALGIQVLRPTSIVHGLWRCKNWWSRCHPPGSGSAFWRLWELRNCQVVTVRELESQDFPANEIPPITIQLSVHHQNPQDSFYRDEFFSSFSVSDVARFSSVRWDFCLAWLAV